MKTTQLSLVCAAALLTACVTVNIYFPAAAAETAAREIVDEILSVQPAKGGTPSPATPADQKPQSRKNPAAIQVFAASMIRIMIPPAAAAQADLNIDSPKIRQLRASLKARHRSLLPYYQSGAIGLTDDGLIALRQPGAVPAPQRSQVRQLIAADNRERQALYRAIAEANGHPEWTSDVQKTFGKVWIQQARSGWWYQGPGGRWAQK